jgi:hypothetical protein
VVSAATWIDDNAPILVPRATISAVVNAATWPTLNAVN